MKRMDVTGSETVAAVALSQTVLRMVVGVIMAAHGFQKLTMYSGWRGQVMELGIPAADLAAPLAMAAELIGGLLLIFGLFTRIAAFGISCVMIVAIMTVHLDKGLFSQGGGFEYPLVLLASAVYFMAAGAGPISLDAFVYRRAQRKAIQRDRTWQQPPYVPGVPEEVLYDRSGRRIERPKEGPGRTPRH